MKLKIPENIMSITPYLPGKPVEELERELGIVDSIKLASNENPLGPSPMAVKAITDAVNHLNRYPDGSGYYLTRELSRKLGVPPDCVVLGNGSDDIIGMLTQVLLDRQSEAIMPKPSFLMYDITVRSAGAKPITVPLKGLSIDLTAMGDKVTERTRVIFLTHPNNPTGATISDAAFRQFVADLPEQTVVVIDEAYIEFVREENCLDSMACFLEGRPLVILRTFSKAYGLAGLRVGYGIMPKELAGMVNRIRMPFNTSSLAQAGALGALQDEVFLQQTVGLVHDGLDFLTGALRAAGIRYFPTQANFLLIDVKKDADEVFDRMLRQGVIIRSMSAYGYSEYIRVTVGRHGENVRLMEALKEAI